MFRKILGIFLVSILSCVELYAQEQNVSYYDSAYHYFQNENFEKALDFYERHYNRPNTGYDNYGTYYAAISACHTGNLEKSKHYLRISAKVGYDLSSYEHFAKHPYANCLQNVPEWKDYIATFKIKADSATTALALIKSKLEDKSRRVNQSLLSDDSYWTGLSKKMSAKKLINAIKNFEGFPQPKESGFWTLYSITVKDTLKVPFLLYIPQDYHPTKKTPLYVYLHGAVVNRTNFADPSQVMGSAELGLMQRAMEDGSFILYPLGKKSFGWVYQQEAFETILKQIVFTKERYNIDDKRVNIGGHSNGGTGAFWFAIKKPTTFSSFFAFNHLPIIYASNTTLRNLNNQSPFYGISGKEDKTFPISIVDNIYEVAEKNGANWKNYTLAGNHGLPFSSYDSVAFIFDVVKFQVRNPFPKSLEWETDDVRNGRLDWIEIVELDTLSPEADWHENIVPSLIDEGKLKVPFNRHRTGAIKAQVKKNSIYLENSRVKKVNLYVSEDMFNLSRPLSVYVNGTRIFHKKLTRDKNFILNEFLKSKDRVFIPSNVIELEIPLQ